MALVTKPIAPGWSRVTPHYHKVRARNSSPFTLASQSYQWAGETWSFTFELPPIKDETTAKAWVRFLYDLARNDSYFVCNVSKYVPATAAQTMQLRLTSPDASWDVGSAMLFGITFETELNQ